MNSPVKYQKVNNEAYLTFHLVDDIVLKFTSRYFTEYLK